MPVDGDDRTDWQPRITRGLTFLGLAVGVLGPFGLLVVGIETGDPLLGGLGVLLVAVVVALVVRRRPPRRP
jgi:hypothetical protein